MASGFLTNSPTIIKTSTMAIKPSPDRSEALMKADHGTVCLITDTQADHYLNIHHRDTLRKAKEIKDSWTI